MSDLAIRVVGLGKRYQIASSGQRRRYKTLQEDLLALPGRVWSAARGCGERQENFWALKDISFEVKQGEVLGIIGRNGAGKSTLLKILANIAEPTTGRAEIYGRVGSLLEVGTGFHQELTGRENVYLSGAILGMTHREVQRKFDAIVDFSGVEKFIDTPAKHYSSGMYMRLAFAVAAHLEPEILLVDEVLAVGDTAFQKKCLGKMGDVAKGGRTVLFVSHNMGAISTLCDRVTLFESGQMKYSGRTNEVIDKYISEVAGKALTASIGHRVDREGNGQIRFVKFHLEDSRGQEVSVLRSGQDTRFVFDYECPDGAGRENVVVSFALKDASGVMLLHHRTNFKNQNFPGIPRTGQFVCHVPRLPLAQGEYFMNVFVAIDEEPCDMIEDAAQVTVEIGDFFGTGSQGMPSLCRVLVDADWALRLDR